MHITSPYKLCEIQETVPVGNKVEILSPLGSRVRRAQSFTIHFPCSKIYPQSAADILYCNDYCSAKEIAI